MDCLELNVSPEQTYPDTDGTALQQYPITRYPTWKDMEERVAAQEKQIAAMQVEIERLTSWRDPLRSEDTPAAEPASNRSVHDTVKDTIDHLLNGRVTPRDATFKSLDRAMDQAKRGAVGTIPGAKG